MARWTSEDLKTLNHARSWREAAASLPHHGQGGVYRKWRQRRGTGRVRREPGPRPSPTPVLYHSQRSSLTRDQQRVAQILSAVYRVAHQEHVAVDVTELLDAIGHGAWRWMTGMDWASHVVVGRDVT